MALINEAVAAELATPGVDDGVWVLSYLTSLARDPEAFSRWLPIKIVPMPESGEHCVRIEMSDAFSGWSAVAAIRDGDIVALMVTRGIGVTDDDAECAKCRYLLLQAHETELWPRRPGVKR